MIPLTLDTLPDHSEWARHLLDPVGDPPEDPEAYTDVETYEAMYGGILAEHRERGADPETTIRRVYAAGRDDPGAVSVRERLFLASPDELLALDRYALRAALAGVSADPDTVVDLGCGYGAALGSLAAAFPDAAVVGGEYATSGVDLARALHADEERVTVHEFDFHGDWTLLDGVDDALVFTRGAVTTLPDVDEVVDRFAALAAAGDVVGGVHLEPVDAHPETTLGLLRRHYARIRGYGGELLAALEARDAIEVTSVEYDAVGANPLHPHTLVRWRPA
ncbi:methyltransferase domain-containing protein [Halorarius halobius]|uniref:methyltransferase domain-containing protein n=1 Tax=Halorarius halobius TaxID=2962671 RepID=UPI0020CBBECD|nr:methyltransferase domain-containing protein [Halorarius halobius]